jgi:hypothetical protein
MELDAYSMCCCHLSYRLNGRLGTSSRRDERGQSVQSDRAGILNEPQARVAAFCYLQGLVEHGLLVPLVEDLDEPTSLVFHGTSQRSAHGLVWNAKPTLSASQLRFLYVQAGLNIPVDSMAHYVTHARRWRHRRAQ